MTIPMTTTVQQSKTLLGLGLDPQSADVHYQDIWDFSSDKRHLELRIGFREPTEYQIPAWSLSALTQLLPPRINNQYDYAAPSILRNQNSYWTVGYAYEPDLSTYMVHFEESTLMEGVYLLMRWLLEHGYNPKDIEL